MIQKTEPLNLVTLLSGSWRARMGVCLCVCVGVCLCARMGVFLCVCVWGGVCLCVHKKLMVES